MKIDKSDKLFNGITACLATAALGLGIVVYGIPPKPKETQEHKIEQIVEDTNYFKGHLKLSGIADYYDNNQQGEPVEIKDIIKKSVAGDKAKEYVAELAENAYKNREAEYLDLESRIGLVKNVMAVAINFLQEKEYGGEGNYTHGYEYSEERERRKEELELEPDMPPEIKEEQFQILINADFGEDTMQTFDEFYGPKDGRILAGDCEDFSIALTTVYHGLKDYAEANQSRDEFFEALAEGLDHYKMVGIVIEDHALNLSITLKDKPEFEVIDLTDLTTEYALEFEEGKAHLIQKDEIRFTILPDNQYESISPPPIPIKLFFNRDFSASDLYLIKK